MRMRHRHASRRALRPVLDGLESRELLSATQPIAAEVRMHGHHRNHTPIVTQLSLPPTLKTTTVPANGDVNPYGIAFVPRGFARGGPLHPGDLLVSNFNNSSNAQGTGSTIVQIPANGTPTTPATVFFQGPTPPAGQAGLGLTTALGILKSGFVLVGNVPTADGTTSTLNPPGSLLILNRFGNKVMELSNSTLLDGPWDLAVNDTGNHPQVFVANVLSGTVTRIDLQVTHHGQSIAVTRMVQIASGYLTRTDPAALLVGPTGLAFDPARNTLYVASTGNNAVFAISHASTTRHDQGMGRMVFQDPHLRGPLGLVLAPNGDLIAANGDAVNADPTNMQDSEFVEFTPSGQFVGEFAIEPTTAGGAFGIAMSTQSGRNAIFAAVDDVDNTVNLFRVHG